MPEAVPPSIIEGDGASSSSALNLLSNTGATAQLRSDLHRYCARMVGSAIDGEDLVQDVFAALYRSAPPLREPTDLRRWMFRTAHHRSLDFLRRYERRMSQSLETAAEVIDASDSRPDHAAARTDAISEALTHYLALPPAQRSCLILMEVFDHSLDEIASLLDVTVPAAKSAMLRGRKRLAAQREPGPATPRHAAHPPSALLLRYCELFNNRDWEGLRSLLVADVRLELVARWEKRGRASVSSYFGNYAELPRAHLRPASFEGREVLAFFANQESKAPEYVIFVRGTAAGVSAIRDFRYAPYILEGATLELS
jgi:RNA polymerase sigma factor (sigma-70 family)